MKFQSSESFELLCVNFFIALTVDWTVPAFHKIKSFVLIDSLSENWTIPSFHELRVKTYVSIGLYLPFLNFDKKLKCGLDCTFLS